MNDTPCPVCNHILNARRLAYYKSEWKEWQRYNNEYLAHRAKCLVLQSAWYQSLWGVPVVVIDAAS